jgi:hypothetical protein
MSSEKRNGIPTRKLSVAVNITDSGMVSLWLGDVSPIEAIGILAAGINQLSYDCRTAAEGFNGGSAIIRASGAENNL